MPFVLLSSQNSTTLTILYPLQNINSWNRHPICWNKKVYILAVFDFKISIGMHISNELQGKLLLQMYGIWKPPCQYGVTSDRFQGKERKEERKKFLGSKKNQIASFCSRFEKGEKRTRKGLLHVKHWRLSGSVLTFMSTKWTAPRLKMPRRVQIYLPAESFEVPILT